jgi:hypothetical protein
LALAQRHALAVLEARDAAPDGFSLMTSVERTPDSSIHLRMFI